VKKVRRQRYRLLWATSACIAVLLGAAPNVIDRACAQGPSAEPQRPLPAGTPQSWVGNAVKYELAIVQDDDDPPLRYRMRKVNDHGDTTRIVMESRQGNVARMIERDGKPLTAAEDAAERSRLNAILQSPADYLKHEHRDDAGKDYVVQLIKLMPRAMIYTYVPGQPQPPGAQSPQIVIDFRPNPAFHPPTMIAEVLTGLAGRIWLDSQTGRMTRAQGHILHPVNFGWGVIARIYSGGTIEFEQTRVDGTRWIYSHLEENLAMRQLLLKTVTDRTKITAWGFEPLPKPLSVDDAVHALLAIPVALQ
jgi:hypothetical protein